MIDAGKVVDLMSLVWEVVELHAPSMDGLPDPSVVAIGAMIGGVVLALWGGRLLRFLFVLAALGLGAAIGVHVARRLGVDILIGLVLGAGLCTLLGYLFYRWWVGLTAGLCALLIVGGVLLVRQAPTLLMEFEGFKDQRTGVGTGDYNRVLEQDEMTLPVLATDFARHYWTERRGQVYRIGFVLGLAWLTGLGMGLTLPRFTTIVGTSLVGVMAAGWGIGLLVRLHRPSLWPGLIENVWWCLGGLGMALIVSLSYQARSGRASPAVAAPPAAET
jgi:hypothetical protein